LARRARETADGRYYDQAAEAVKKSLQLAPDNLEARKVETWLLLGKHEFADALARASELSRRAPNDPTVYGFIVDACAELGKYPEAEEAAQRMLDLGRSSVPGLTRAAYLREIFGDIEGAADLMIKALDKLNSSLVEDRAWVLTHLGHLRALTGDLENADSLLNEALRLFPEYHYANFHLAKVRSMQSRYADAVDLLRRRYDAAPHPENLYDLAAATERAGRRPEAHKLFRDFEKAALAETHGADNANRELIFYYTDHANRPKRALEVAVRELARRRDVHTLDAVAWALHRNGKHADARREIEAALKVGIRDSRIFYHA
jgi:tetratricopeptide (TPR) repeat protein